jgi:hypothetical protein
VPVDSAKWPSPAAFIDPADASPLAGKTVPIPTPTPPDVATQAHIKEAYGKLPLSFEANHGQTDLQV